MPEPFQSHRNPFLDQYVVKFLDLQDVYHENNFRKVRVKGIRNLILELGKDITFVGEEYPIQIGGEHFRIGLLFFHRALHCLAAIGLKFGKSMPKFFKDGFLLGMSGKANKKAG